MATITREQARLNFRVPADVKQTIEEAAARLGQTVTDYAVSTLALNARQVLRDHDVTELSRRDRDLFLAMLGDTQAKPNRALKAAARKYRKRRAG